MLSALIFMFCWLEPLLWLVVRHKRDDAVWWVALLLLGMWVMVAIALEWVFVLTVVANINQAYTRLRQRELDQFDDEERGGL